MNLTRLLLIHAIVTGAAGVVLIGAPKLIPGVVGIQLPVSAYLISYLLGAAEVSLAVLSYLSTKLSDQQALRVVCLTFVVFHGLTALVEVYAFVQRARAQVWVNVLVRVVVVGAFIYYGFGRKCN